MACAPNFERSISLNDLDSSLKVREMIQEDIVSPEDETKHCHLKNTSEYTFVLKSFKELSLDYKKFLYSYLLDVGIYKDLEGEKKLNWCPSLFPMVPVLTLADGNCLLHAASIGMWAVNDRYHTLRKLVYNAILEDTEGIFHKRWQREHELTTLSPHGYSMTEEQWTKEWQIVLQLVSQEEHPIGQTGMRFDSLEEIHIFVLANVLRRTIIVISSDTLRGNYDESLSPVHFPGIYLPLNWDPVDCFKTPLVIGYSQGHFTSMVSFEDGVFDQGEAIDGVEQMLNKIHGVPLQKQNGTPLSIHFLFENEEYLTDGLLRQYLDCKKLAHKDPQDETLAVTLVAKLNFVPPPDPVKKLVDGFFSHAWETYLHMVQTKTGRQSGDDIPSLALQECITEGCEFFGTSDSSFMCSKCLEQHLRSEGNKVAPVGRNLEFSVAGAAFKDEYVNSRLIGAGTALGKEPSRTTAGIGVLFLEETPQRQQLQEQRQRESEHLQQQQFHQREIERLQQQKLQQQEIERLQQLQQRQRESERLQQQQQQEQQQQEQQQQESELLRQQELQQREFEHVQQQRKRESELLQQQQQRKRESELWKQQQQRQQESEPLQQQHQLQRERQLLHPHQQRETITLLQQQEIDLLQQQLQEQRITQEPNKCITNGCKYKENEETGNLCVRCHESDMMAEQYATSIISMNIQAKPCANSVNGCQLYGIPQQEDFCSRCYRKFCLEMESLVVERNSEETTFSPSAAVSPPPPPDNICQTLGCPNTGCPELYDRCVQCYSTCIKTFITSHESRSQLTSSALVEPSPQPSPQAPHSQLSPALQVLPIQNPLCSVPCCQNNGVVSYNGQCVECHRIKPWSSALNISANSTSSASAAHAPTATSAINMPTNTTPSTSAAHAPTTTAGLSSGEPALEESGAQLYCKTPKCNNPVGESDSRFCTQCIMAHFKQDENAFQQLLQNPSSSSGLGFGSTKELFSRENLPVGLGAAGFGLEKVGLQGSASEERRKNAAIARQNLPLLYIPSSSAKTAWNSPLPGSTVSTNTPAANIRCVAPNCQFFGNAEHNFYCSTCYEKSREEWEKISDLAQMRHQDHLIQEPFLIDPRAGTGRARKMRGCALKYCYNLETPGNNGLCDRCFKTAITSEREWTSTNRARNEQQRRPPPIQVPTATTTSFFKPLKKNFIDTGSPCKTEGCLKFGTAANQGLCVPCYARLQRNQASASGSSRVPVSLAQPRTLQPSRRSNLTNKQFMQTSAVNTTISVQSPITVTQQSSGAGLGGICKQEGCRMTGTPEYGGYCSRCLVDYTRQSSYPESVPDIKDSPESHILTNRPSVLSPNGPSLTSTLTTATATVARGLTTLQPSAPGVCATEKCENLVQTCTTIHCDDCLAKYAGDK